MMEFVRDLQQLKNKKPCLMYQPCGLGDIFFIQKIITLYKEMGYEVWLPVVHEFEWLNEYLCNAHYVSWGDNDRKITGPPLPENVKFPFKELYNPTSPSFESEELAYINFFNLPCDTFVMRHKYTENKIAWENWADFLIFKRNKKKEDELFYNVLGLRDGEPYALVNNLYCTRPSIIRYGGMNVSSGIRIVFMDILKDYSIFDWCKVVENASEITMIESALNYVMESPLIRHNLKAKKLNLYSRINDFSKVRYLFNLPWNYITQ